MSSEAKAFVSGAIAGLVTALYFVGLFFLPFAASVHGWVAKPVWVLAMFGAVPAFLIGLLGQRLYLARREARKVTERLDAVYAKDDSRLDPELIAAQTRALRERS